MPGPYIASKSKQRGSPMRTITALFVGLGSIGTRHLKNLTNLCADRGCTLQADALRSDLSRPLRDAWPRCCTPSTPIWPTRPHTMTWCSSRTPQACTPTL